MAKYSIRNHLRKRVLHIYRGAPDENARLWLREEEAKELLESSSKGYQPTFFIKEGMWRSSRGYFKLFRHRNGTKGLVFVFDYGDLAVDEVKTSAFPEGVRHTPKNYKHTYLAAKWPAQKIVKLSDITRAIDAFSSELRKATLDEAVLYEMDIEKGIYRSGGAAYVLEKQQRHGGFLSRISEIFFYSKIMANGSLANPFGETIPERLVQTFDPGVGLLHLLARREEKSEPRRFRAGRKLPRSSGTSHALPGAEALMYQHYLTASLRYLREQDPATDDDRQLNKKYYKVRRHSQLVSAIIMGGRNWMWRISFERAPQIRGLIGSFYTIFRNLFLGGMVFAAYGAVLTGIYAWGLIQRRGIDPDVLVDLRDPAVHQLSNDARLIAPFQTLLRPLRKEALEDITLLSKPTFDRIPPYGIKTAESLDVWPYDLLEPSVQERGRSFVRFYYSRDRKPSKNPAQYVQAIKIQRADGIVSVKFTENDSVWCLYLGSPLDPRTPAPPAALQAQLEPGHVVQIANTVDSEKPIISKIPIEEAERIFQERFGRPLVADIKLCLKSDSPWFHPKKKNTALPVAPTPVPDSSPVPPGVNSRPPDFWAAARRFRRLIRQRPSRSPGKDQPHHPSV